MTRARKPTLGLVGQRPDEPDQGDQAAKMLIDAGLDADELDDPPILRAMLAEMAVSLATATIQRDNWQAVAREAFGVTKALAGPLAGHLERIAGTARDAAALNARIADLEVERDHLVNHLRHCQRQMSGRD